MNLNDAFFSLDNYFSPKIIGEVNGQYIKVVKIKGQEVPWHSHENEDELFYIIDGQLLMEMENQVEFTMKKGDLFVVRKEQTTLFPSLGVIYHPILRLGGCR